MIINEKILIFLPRIKIRGYFREVPFGTLKAKGVPEELFDNSPRDLSLGYNFQFICYFIILNRYSPYKVMKDYVYVP